MSSRVVLLDSLAVGLFGSEYLTDDALDRLRSALISDLPALIEATARARGIDLVATVTT